MGFSYKIPVALIGAAVVVVQPQVAVALSAPQVNAIAKELTVRIDGQDTGTGIIVNRSGNTYTVLTNWHVVKEAGTYTVQTNDGKSHSVNYSEVRQLPGLDLAVLPFASSQNYRVAKLGNSNSVTEGMTVYVAGWVAPDSPNTERGYRFLTGQISERLRSPRDGGYAFVYSNAAKPGMSGGPVLDEEGRVVAINGLAVVSRIEPLDYLGIPINAYLPPAQNPQTRSLRKPQVVTFLSRGVEKTQEGDYSGAIAAFNEAINLNPEYAEAYARRGYARAKLGNFPRAILDGNVAVRKNPKLALAYYYRGLIYSEGKEYLRAIVDCNQAIRLDPNYASAYYLRGIADRQVGNNQGASADLQKAANLFLAQGNRDDYQRTLKIIRQLQR